MDAGKTSCICICTLKYISIADALKNYPARLPPIDEPSGIIGCTTGNSKATRRTHLSPERAVSPHPPAPSSDLLQFSPEHRRRTLLQWYHNLYIGQTYMSCEQLRQISYFKGQSVAAIPRPEFNNSALTAMFQIAAGRIIGLLAAYAGRRLRCRR